MFESIAVCLGRSWRALQTRSWKTTNCSRRTSKTRAQCVSQCVSEGSDNRPPPLPRTHTQCPTTKWAFVTPFFFFKESPHTLATYQKHAKMLIVSRTSKCCCCRGHPLRMCGNAVNVFDFSAAGREPGSRQIPTNPCRRPVEMCGHLSDLIVWM